MSRGKLVAVLVLVAALSFLTAFIPTVALSMRDQDGASTAELDLAAALPHHSDTTGQVEQSETNVAARPVQPNVDPDCYGDGLVCEKRRIADVEALATVIAPVLSSHGWPSGCFEVRILGGDGAEADAVSISVNGRPGLDAARCREPGARGATKQQLAKLGGSLKGLIASTKSARNVDLLQVTDGVDVDVQVPLQENP